MRQSGCNRFFGRHVFVPIPKSGFQTAPPTTSLDGRRGGARFGIPTFGQKRRDNVSGEKMQRCGAAEPTVDTSRPPVVRPRAVAGRPLGRFLPAFGPFRAFRGPSVVLYGTGKFSSEG